MTRTIQEGALSFEFADNWHVLKLDDHTYYRGKSRLVPDRKSVDIVGTDGDKSLCLMEVKDYRDQTKKRLTSGGLLDDFNWKVHDSVSSLVGGARMAGGEDDWTPLADRLVNRGKRLWALLWLEEESHTSRVSPERMKQKRDALQKTLQQCLRWLTPHVRLIDLRNYQTVLPGVTVSSLAQQRDTRLPDTSCQSS
jgi:hypothetical protein